MNSRDYWKKREDEARKNTIRDEQEYNKRLNEIYQYTIANIERQVNDWYARYASKEGITMAEARGRVKHIDMERYERLAAKYVATHDFSEQANQEMALYNLTMKVNRLELLKAEINLELMAGFDDIEHEMERDLIRTAMKEDRRLAGILGDSVIGNEEYARQLVNASFRNATFSERIWGRNMPDLRIHLEAELRNGLVQGIGSDELARRFRKHYGGSIRDTERLMTTEMCRLQTAVQKESFERNGYKEYMFITSGNDNVCPDCEALHGQHFKVSEMQAGVNAPPMHPRCVLPDTKIIAPALEAITKSYYLGEVIEFTLSDGRRLTVSPNHIMLTPRGWVRAQDITKSDYVISYRRGVEPVLEGNPTDNDGVPSIEQVFTALAESQGVSTTCVPATTEDLKGDVVADTEIEIIPTDSKLWNKLDATKRKMLCDIGFVGTGKSAEIALNALGTFAKCLLTLGLASDRIVRGLSVKPLFFWRSLTCSQLISLRTPSDYNARLAETAIDSASANTKTSGERIGTFARFVKLCDQIRIKVLSSICRNTKSDAVFDKHTLDGFGFVSSDFRYLTQTFAREIQIDDIVNIRRFNYFGHVYDTSCMVTLYTANGVITSNCHCSTAAYMDSDKYKRWIDALANGEDVRWNEFDEYEENKRKESEMLTERRRQRLEARRNRQSAVAATATPAAPSTEVKYDSRVPKQQVDVLKALVNEYRNRLANVTVGARRAAGNVDISGAEMRLNSKSIETAVHEFAHTMANSSADKYGLTNDKGFWKEIRKIYREYHKDVDKNYDVHKRISSYEYGQRSIDEFMAEAFAHAKMRELGIPISDTYGNDYTYSQRVLDVIDKYFKK